MQNAFARLLSGSERSDALAYFRSACANDARSGHSAGEEERANFTRVLWFLVERSAFVWVYEPGGVAASVAWRLGVYEGRCFGALCWDVVSCHVRPGCMSVSFVELPPHSAPWLRSAVGAPKAKGRPKKASKKADRAARFQGGAASAPPVTSCVTSDGASSSDGCDQDGLPRALAAYLADAEDFPATPEAGSDAVPSDDELGPDGLPLCLSAYLSNAAADEGFPVTPGALSDAVPSDDDLGTGDDCAGQKVARPRRKKVSERSRPKVLQTDGHDVPVDAWKRFTPDVIDVARCQARTFAGGHGGQCSQRPVPG